MMDEPEPDRTRDRNTQGCDTQDHEAVRAAEQAVSDAWIGQLLLAESETEAFLGAHTRVRQRAVKHVREAQRSGDLAALARSQTDLDLADAACGRAVAAHEHARTRLAHELTVWSRLTACRLRQARSDQARTRRR